MTLKLVPAALALMLINGPVVRAEEAPAPLTKAQLEQTIRTYLLEHPELLTDMTQALQKKQADQQREITRAALTTKRAELVSDAGSPVAGQAKDGDGVVTIVEFFDYRCGYCKKVNPTVQKLVADDPSIRVVFKEFPILGPESTTAATAALAAHEQGEYLKFHRALMASNDYSLEAIVRLATESGLDAERLKKDMAKPELQAALARNRELGEALAIQATPSFVIGDQVVPGAIDEAGFKGMIAKAKEQSKSFGAAK